MSNNSSNNNVARGNVNRRAHRGGSGSSSVTVKQRLPRPSKKSDGTMLDEYRDDQRSMSSACDSFSSAPSLSLADEVEVARSSENTSSRGQQQQRNGKTRGKKHGVLVVHGVRRQLPLSEVVSRRAFECVVGTDGEISKLVDVAENGTSAAAAAAAAADAKSQGDHHCAKPTSMDALKKEADINLRRGSCERCPTPAYWLEALPHGTGISIGSQVGADEKARPKSNSKRRDLNGGCFLGIFRYFPEISVFLGIFQ